MINDDGLLEPAALQVDIAEIGVRRREIRCEFDRPLEMPLGLVQAAQPAQRLADQVIQWRDVLAPRRHRSAEQVERGIIATLLKANRSR